MEAIGTLSGGIVHDFNNILQTVLGSIQLLIARKNSNHPDLEYLSLVEKAVDRAQDLTSRLLYFSKDIISNLEPIDLIIEISNSVSLLKRTLPKMIQENLLTRRKIL